MDHQKKYSSFNFVICILVSILFSFYSCKDTGTKESSPTMGDIKIACDLQLKEIMQQEQEIFQQNYRYAKVELIYQNESSVFKLMQNDSIKTAITCRLFSDQEIKYYNTVKKIHPKSYPFAIGALALLCNKDVRDTGIVYEDFINLCSGMNEQHSGFNTVVVENVGSGIAQFLLDKIQAGQFAKNVYTLDNLDSIFSYLEGNKQAVAVIDWSEFSDSDNSMQQQRLKKCKILGISRPKDSIQLGCLLPDQYLLQDNKYPLTRTFYMLSVTGKSDLGLGFASFITGDIGQRILLKAGLLPLYQSERWIELKSGSYKVVE